MAKRKLSGSQRLSLRKELKRRIAAGIKPVKFLEKIAAKYSLSPVTVRWYLKGLAGGGARPGKAGKRKSTAKRKPVRKTRRRRRRRAAGNAQAGTTALIRKAQAAARDRAKEAATLKRLLPEYNSVRRSQEKLQGRLQEVRQIERAVSRSLRQAAKRVKKLEAQLRGLVKA